MGSFSIWHWIIVLAIVGVIVWLVLKARNMKPSDKQNLQGIGGWLAFLAFNQVVGLIRLVLSVVENFRGYGPLMDVPGAKAVMATETAINAALFILAVATTVALFKKKRSFVNLFTYQWLAIPVATVLNIVLTASILNIKVSDFATAEDIRTTVAPFIAAGIWVWYTRVSVRVRNTMVN